ncbi:MAG: type II/IV secretion system protein [Bacteroidetes bacterium]|nr:MAG: type II/IV secretion system protein [Bacteroidota bacterium]
MMFAREDLHFRDHCLQRSLLTRERWEQFVDHASNYGMARGFSAALVEAGVFPAEELPRLIAEAFTVPVMTLYAESGSAPKEIIPETVMHSRRVIPMFLFGNELTVAMVDPPYRSLLEELGKMTGMKIIPVITDITDFFETLKINQGGYDELKRLASAIDLEKYDLIRSGEKEVKRLEQMGAFPPLIMLVDEVIVRAVKMGASDIHLEPFEHEVRLRFRFDGVLQRIASFPATLADGLAAVVKNKAGMDIFEKRRPQDGRLSLTIESRSFDLRVNSLPTVHGEKLVLRILSKGSINKKMEDLGLSGHNLSLLLHLLQQPNGLLLVTGPTGSGKSTTLYAAINHIRSVEKNIVTVENPVEYMVETVNQVNVDPERNLTFANALRAMLRQDPDVALVGEIRDTETGTIATEAALTGHLVLSTLHTNDAVGAVPRLINMGVPSYWLAPALIGVVGQRLVRRLCPSCREEYRPTDEVLYKAGISGLASRTVFYRAAGCPACHHQGYRGRIAIHEVFRVSEEIQTLIYQNAETSRIRDAAVKDGFRDLRFDGLKKVIAGLTTLEEVQRVTRSAI